MIVGDPGRFALEFALDSDPTGDWLNGWLRLWCGGRHIGVSDPVTSLRDTLFALEQEVWARGNRRNDALAALPGPTLLRVLDAFFFGDADPRIAAMGEKEQWARHLIAPSVPGITGVKVFLVENSTCARLLFVLDGGSEAGETGEVQLRPGEVDLVLRLLTEHLSGLYRGDGSPGCG